MSDSASASSNFERVFGRAATATEREQLRHVQTALGLRDNDALWLVLFALQYYESLYRQFPKAIAGEAARVLTETRAAADSVIRASAEQARADLAKAVASVAHEVARDTAHRAATQWVIAGMAVGVAIFALGWCAGVWASR
ncbi:MAG: hypothetical protein KGM42_00440 [Hyphomicrobiales bacterium]|nr:hypothetical protein [Hyphomicrobiales bacterium]